ncbi:MAG: SIS domain-containing protein [Anaerolineae bacterium]|jgi:D-sedoheptulose 7-phosphate isomerase
MNEIRRYLGEVQNILRMLSEEAIRDVVDVLLSANYVGSTIFTLGNGGSAATASHFACDLAKGTITADRPRFRVIPLTDNVPLMTAWSNDVAYEDMFAEQLRNLIREGDVVVAFSGSGNSENVLRAVRLARQARGITIGLSGFLGGTLKDVVDVPLVVPSHCMEQIEDVHVILCHLIATVLRQQMEEIEPPTSLMLETAATRSGPSFVVAPRWSSRPGNEGVP